MGWSREGLLRGSWGAAAGLRGVFLGVGGDELDTDGYSYTEEDDDEAEERDEEVRTDDTVEEEEGERGIGGVVNDVTTVLSPQSLYPL